MGSLLYRFWPVLIPILAYLLWHEVRRRKARKAGETPARIHEGPWLLTLGASLVIAVACVFGFALTTDSRTDVSYEPAHIIDGQVVKGHLEPRNDE